MSTYHTKLKALFPCTFLLLLGGVAATCPEGTVKVYVESGTNDFMELCINAEKLNESGIGYLHNVDDTDDNIPDYGSDMDQMWLLIAGAMVFLMQAGFSMLEAGSVGAKNTVNILYKNILDACIGALCFWLFGYGFAYGGDSAGGFIGTSNFALPDEDRSNSGWHSWFFQFAFAATAATIVSGSVAERTKFSAYFIYSIIITTFIYPVVVHWVWGSGWLSAWGATNGPLFSRNESSNGFVDFAGSGVVHMVGGFAGLVGAFVVGPRQGRFEVMPNGKLGNPLPMPGHSMVICALGVIILWFGWYGFNVGCTLCALGCMDLASKVAVTTTLAAAAGCMTSAFLSKLFTGKFDLATGLNGVIAGLVSITAPCPVVDPWAAVVIGFIGAFVYIFSDKLLLAFHIDDPLQACPLHGFCGIWGCLAVGIFGTDEKLQAAGYPNVNGAFASGEQFGVQVVGVIAILAWTIATSLITFYGIKFSIGMRVTAAEEEEGLDASEHGASSYTMGKMANFADLAGVKIEAGSAAVIASA